MAKKPKYPLIGEGTFDTDQGKLKANYYIEIKENGEAEYGEAFVIFTNDVENYNQMLSLFKVAYPKFNLESEHTIEIEILYPDDRQHLPSSAYRYEISIRTPIEQLLKLLS